MNIFTADSTVGRALRVFGYLVVTALLALLADPGAVQSITDRYPAVSLLVVVLPPVLSAIVNGARRDVPNT